MKFFENFDFEKLNDFCVLNFIPITTDMNKYLSTDCSYENMVSHEQPNINTSTFNKKGKKEHIPSDYDKNWAIEF